MEMIPDNLKEKFIEVLNFRWFIFIIF
jgi:hypothetical protein